MLERLHATLESILTRAHGKGLDWVKQLAFALFALRPAPSRSTGFSPYELVYGRNIRTPLDILYEGWRDKGKQRLVSSIWVEELCDRLKALRDTDVEKGLCEKQEERAACKGKCERELEVDDLVLCNIPGLGHKLEDSWDGPFE